jgi:hypothetical protein
MRIWKCSLLGAFWVAVSAAAQSSAGFDTATVKRAAASTSDEIEIPGRIHYASISVKALLGRAYDSYSEIAGPGWMDSHMIEVDATMPPQTTKEQSKQMLQNLIVERFKLKFHVDKRDMNKYVLLVAKERSEDQGSEGGNRSLVQSRMTGFYPVLFSSPDKRRNSRFTGFRPYNGWAQSSTRQGHAEGVSPHRQRSGAPTPPLCDARRSRSPPFPARQEVVRTGPRNPIAFPCPSADKEKSPPASAGKGEASSRLPIPHAMW